MPSRSFRHTVSLTATLGLCACGGPDNTYLLDFVYGSDTILVAPDNSGSELAPATFVSLDGLFFKVETLTFRLADLRMDLPPEVRCQDYEDVLSPEMSCEDSVAGRPGALHLPDPVEVGTGKRLSVGGEQVFIPRVYYPAIDTRWVPGTPEHPSFQLRARFTYQGEPHVLEFAFQSDEPMRFERRGISTGLPKEFSDHPAAFGGSLDMDDGLAGTDISGCLATGDLTLDGNVLRLETGRGACADAATNMRLSIQRSGDLFTGLRL
ncbi:hypothetical protein [Corallococcus carmarthensis]|uniref:Lipoprotein n=1 Tax=Corallococcus carmarthensis TaxID=2316728 RepID=A0A3A8JXB6_9BACT|nr:hypothetical protein [Corallococcus carmarthensis]NOK16357.1 hypothetical protein [Corallococcus carmarthensis]RKH00573.1 hypothetical protein D7X32_23145 [Corallococcus carmarthensis]